MQPTTTEIATKVYSRWQQADNIAATWRPLWQQLANYFRPDRDQVTRRTTNPYLDQRAWLFDGTGIQANMTFAAGCMSWLTPAETPWFQLQAPRALKDSEPVKSWLSECTEITHEELGRSNFYAEQHECYLDRGAFGTGCLFATNGERNALHFENWEVGQWACTLDREGYIDGVFREYEMTAREAVQKFGEKNLPDTVNDKDANKALVKHCFIHAIYPRSDAERDGLKIDGPNKPIASVVLHSATKSIVSNEGFDEMPAFVTRHLKWGRSPYGVSPAWQALPDLRQLNDLVKNMDVLAEVAAFPRMLLPAEQDGEVDLRASGATYFRDPQRLPREWMTQGRYDIGKDREDVKRKMIRDAFNVDAFQMFAQITKQMTAHEVEQRRREKLDLFSPTFAMLTNELFTPLLRRVFAILLRAGAYPAPPQELMTQTAAGVFIPDPDIAFTSRIALALKAVHSSAFDSSLMRRTEIAKIIGPSAFDDVNLTVALSELDRDNGLPEAWRRKPDEVAAIQQARAEAAAKAEQMAMLEQGTKAMGNLAKVPPEAQEKLGAALNAA